MAIQPISGTVITVCAPVAWFCWTNRSVSEPFGRLAGSGLSFGMFSKYQSEARLVVSARKL